VPANRRARSDTVTDVAQRLLAHHGGLRGLFRLDVAELARVCGLGDAKTVQVKAAPEVGWCLAVLLTHPQVRFPCADVAPASDGCVASPVRSCSRKTLARRACRAVPLSRWTLFCGARLRRKGDAICVWRPTASSRRIFVLVAGLRYSPGDFPSLVS
jgi:hypothetical protein